MRVNEEKANPKAVELRKKYWNHFNGQGQNDPSHRVKDGTLLYTDVVREFSWKDARYSYKWCGMSIDFNGWSRGGNFSRYEELTNGFSIWVMSTFDSYEDGYYLMLVNSESEVENYIYWSGNSPYGGTYLNEHLAEKFTDKFITLSLDGIRNVMNVMATSRLSYNEQTEEEREDNRKLRLAVIKSIME